RRGRQDRAGLGRGRGQEARRQEGRDRRRPGQRRSRGDGYRQRLSARPRHRHAERHRPVQRAHGELTAADRDLARYRPGVGIVPGETPRQAALGELREEGGTDKAAVLAESRGWYASDLPGGADGGLWGGRYRGQRQKWFALRFTGSDEDINLATEHPEFDAWQWLAPARLTELIVPFKRDIYRAVFAEFAPLLTA